MKDTTQPVQYVSEAMKRAAYSTLEDDEGVFGTIAGFSGLWGHGATEAECAADLRSRLEGWLIVSKRLGIEVPE